MTRLHFDLVGEGRPRFIFLHGLLGRGRNWTQIATGLAADGLASVLFDLPNHGESSWTDHFSYTAMAHAVTAEIELRLGSAAQVVLVGHSMGGKVAMLAALTRPELFAGLAVVDIAPGHSAQVSSFNALLGALRGLDLAALTSRTEADHLLKAQIPDDDVRGFLLSNLRRRDGWSWQPNLELLAASLADIGGWPEVEASYSGPVLWLTGERSAYVQPEHHQQMYRLFPATEQIVVPGAGHWVHADNPVATVAALRGLAERTATVG